MRICLEASVKAYFTIRNVCEAFRGATGNLCYQLYCTSCLQALEPVLQFCVPHAMIYSVGKQVLCRWLVMNIELDRCSIFVRYRGFETKIGVRQNGFAGGDTVFDLTTRIPCERSSVKGVIHLYGDAYLYHRTSSGRTPHVAHQRGLRPWRTRMQR